MDELSSESIKQIAETQEFADELALIGLADKLAELEKRIRALEQSKEAEL